MAKQSMIFGLQPVLEAVKSGKEFEKILLSKGAQSELSKELFHHIRQMNIPFQFVPGEKLNRITSKNHQGAIAYVSQISYVPVEELVQSIFEKGDTPFLMYLDKITDVRNFGAISRTAECAGVQGIIIPQKGASPVTADAIKTSSGALNHIPVCRIENPVKTIEYLKNSGLQIFCATEHGDTLYFQADYKNPLLLVMGAEDKGIAPGILQLTDNQIKIPVLGNISSLNVSVAAGVIMYEVLKQRQT